MNTTQHLPNKAEGEKLIPFEFVVKLPDTQLFGNKPKIGAENRG